ncbi:MAG TPA: hypothetical protein VLG50_00895 [Candidatus Saccharimonadales bacterium]|nr:hypothetical protein [Candidatus Saccharimonadales bacterium]
MSKQKFIFLCVTWSSGLVFSVGGIFQEEKLEQLKIGNLALPTSQQPGPLLGFGQNIVDKHDLQVFAYVDYLNGTLKSFTEVWPTLLYGIKDYLSLFIQLPIAAQSRQNNRITHGLQDLLVQFEYALYEKNKETATNQITVVANMTFPTSCIAKQLPSAYGGSPSFFFGLTASHMGQYWYPFAATGVIITTPHNHVKLGNQFLYEWGLSKNISYRADKWIFNWMLEMHGLYKQRTSVAGKINRNSGENEILFGPSLWFSTQNFIIQGGIAGSVYYKLFGNQKNKDKYYSAIDIGYKF